LQFETQKVIMLGHLKVGDTAPFFEGNNEEDQLISIDDYKGKRLILFFYPKDMTPGCTFEVQSLRNEYDKLIDHGLCVVGVSADSVKRHRKFVDKENLPFHLISDEDKVILEAYGVWGLKKFMGREYDGIHRTTFIIEKDRRISHIIKKVKTKDHANQILDLINDNN